VIGGNETVTSRKAEIASQQRCSHAKSVGHPPPILLHHELHRYAQCISRTKGSSDLLVVRTNHKDRISQAVVDPRSERPLDQRSAQNRHHGFAAVLGHQTQPGSAAGGEHDDLHQNPFSMIRMGPAGEQTSNRAEGARSGNFAA